MTACSLHLMWTFKAESRGEPSPGASLRYMPGSGTWRPFRGLTEKQTPAEGFTQRGDCCRRRVRPQRTTCLYRVAICVYVCMHVCTYIIHVNQAKGQKNREHSTYIRRGGKGVRGLKRPCLSLGAQVFSAEAPLVGRQLGEWVGGTQREEPLAEVNRVNGKLTDVTCASWQAFNPQLLIKHGINNKGSNWNVPHNN